MKIAAATELIHMASIVHDDVIDNSDLRRSKPTINCKWGKEISIALGDWLFSTASELISDCDGSDIMQCLSIATREMCEGELLQLCERGNLSLPKRKYILIVKKKTATLFAACCKAGAIISNAEYKLYGSLSRYGMNFGIAFQIVGDYLDITGEKIITGKMPGKDIELKEMTLPLLNLFKILKESDRKILRNLISTGTKKESLKKVRDILVLKGPAGETKKEAMMYIYRAKREISILKPSVYKKALTDLSDFIIEGGSILNSAHIGLLASLGVSRINLKRKPKIAILATGDEVIDIEEELKPGKL